MSLSENEQISLANLIVNNPDFDKLESMLSDFNLFETIGVTNQELKHSNLLAFLLSSRERHGLGDRFLKQLLSTTFAKLESPPLSALEIDLADLSDVEVKREWHYIDLLICSPSNHWVIAVENKVDSGEHDDQLRRYEETIEAAFPDYEKKAFVYLTKEGDTASRTCWRSLSYGSVADLLENLSAEHRSSINDDVCMLIRHYINLIRRRIVSDSEIAQLCRKIYRQHHQALTLIYEHRPDLQLEIADFLRALIAETEGIEQEDSRKDLIRCVPASWDKVPSQKACSVLWTSSRRLSMFEFFNNPNSLEFKLTIGPGEYADKKTIYDVVAKLNIPGSINSHLKPNGYSPVFCQNVLTASDYFEEDWTGIKKKIHDFWERFLKQERTQIDTAFEEIEVPAKEPSLNNCHV